MERARIHEVFSVHRRHHLALKVYLTHPFSVPVRHHKCEHIWTVRIRKRTLAAGTRTMKNECLSAPGTAKNTGGGAIVVGGCAG